ncbi:MAG: hypothetical protein ABW094_12320 [Candidatus Thiodiazotropha sp.]
MHDQAHLGIPKTVDELREKYSDLDSYNPVYDWTLDNDNDPIDETEVRAKIEEACTEAKSACAENEDTQEGKIFEAFLHLVD